MGASVHPEFSDKVESVGVTVTIPVLQTLVAVEPNKGASQPALHSVHLLLILVDRALSTKYTVN